jgi:hypothetical protein
VLTGKPHFAAGVPLLLQPGALIEKSTVGVPAFTGPP